MKFICSKSDLLKSINIVLKAVPSRTTMSILQCILIEAEPGKIKMTANDMELGIETSLEGDVLDRGTAAIDAKIFSEIIRKLPDNDVTIETDENFQMLISCEKARFHISGKSGEEFSHLPFIEKEEPVVISQFSLREMIKQTIFSISDNESNKIMTGELFELSGNHLRIVALDGHRVSIRNLYLKEEYAPKKVIVPGKTLMEVSKILLGELESFVNIYFTANHIVFEFDDTTVVSRLIEGEYFLIDHMISSDYETKVEVNKREFSDCIDRATLLVRENDKKPIVIQIEDGEMRLKLTSSVGSMNEEIAIEKEGKDILIAFNPKFMLDALRVIDDETVTLYMVNPKAPCFIRDEKESYIYMVLPVNFNNAG